MPSPAAKPISSSCCATNRMSIAAMSKFAAWPPPAGAASRVARSGREPLGAYLVAQAPTLARLTLRHLLLVAVSLVAAVLVAAPLGLLLERTQRVAEIHDTRRGPAPDDPRHRAPGVHDPAARHRRRAGAGGALSLLAVPDSPEHLHRRPQRGSGRGERRDRDRYDAGTGAALRAVAAGGAR